MQATANVKHDEIARLDSDEDRRWSAMQRARAVAEYSRQEAQRVSSWAGELLQLAHLVHTEEQVEIAALVEELRYRSLYEESLHQALQNAKCDPWRTGR